jgi:tetratricopeptide (TPR) repeat protein
MNETNAGRGAPIIATLTVVALAAVGLAVYEARRPAEPPPRARPAPGARGAPAAPAASAAPAPPAIVAAEPPPARPLEPRGDPIAAQLNNEGLDLYTRGEFAAAAERFRQALERDHGNSTVRANLAFALANIGWRELEQGRYDAAAAALEEAAALRVAEPSIGVGLGLAYHRLGDDDRAIERLKQAVADHPRQAQAYKLLGEIYYGRDELEMALGYYERATEIDGGDVALRQRVEKTRRELAAQGGFREQATRMFTVKFEGRRVEETATRILRLLEQAYREIGQELSYFPDQPITVVLYSNQQFRDVTRTPSWSQALFDGKIRIPVDGHEADPALLEKVVRHEYTHALVHALCDSGVPTWLNEGLALNLESATPADWDGVLARRLAGGGALLPLESLHGSFMGLAGDQAQLAYAMSFAAVRQLVERHGYYRIRQLLDGVADRVEFERAFSDAFLISYSQFQASWRRDLESRLRGRT